MTHTHEKCWNKGKESEGRSHLEMTHICGKHWNKGKESYGNDSYSRKVLELKGHDSERVITSQDFRMTLTVSHSRNSI
jgi:hypothetical protein